jgi:3-methyl-2-oxobutanoate hydroxymethyltransferase
VSEVLSIPTIGIGAGAGTDAQVIVWQDLVGLTPGPHPRFVTPYADIRATLADAVSRWGADVVSGAYPRPEHEYA